MPLVVVSVGQPRGLDTAPNHQENREGGKQYAEILADGREDTIKQEVRINFIRLELLLLINKLLRPFYPRCFWVVLECKLMIEVHSTS